MHDILNKFWGMNMINLQKKRSATFHKSAINLNPLKPKLIGIKKNSIHYKKKNCVTIDFT